MEVADGKQGGLNISCCSALETEGWSSHRQMCLSDHSSYSMIFPWLEHVCGNQVGRMCLAASWPEHAATAVQTSSRLARRGGCLSNQLLS